MKSCYKSLKELDFQRKLYSSWYHIFESKYFLLILKAVRFWKKFFWHARRVYFWSPFVFYLCERDATSSQINFTFVSRWFISCILYQHKKVAEIKKLLNKDFENVCDWFVENKLSIHFAENNTKSILFAGKRKSKNVCQLNIRYNHINIKQHA